MKDVPRVPKCIPRWGSTPNHFFMGSKMKSCTIHLQTGDPETIGSDVPNLMKDVPNFVKDVLSVPKCIPRWGLAPNHFLMGSKMKSCTIHVQMGDSETIGLDVPNFVKDIPSVPKCIPR